jgi:hypothetical protein
VGGLGYQAHISGQLCLLLPWTTSGCLVDHCFPFVPGVAMRGSAALSFSLFPRQRCLCGHLLTSRPPAFHMRNCHSTLVCTI